jgi:hypothetical protein
MLDLGKQTLFDATQIIGESYTRLSELSPYNGLLKYAYKSPNSSDFNLRPDFISEFLRRFGQAHGELSRAMTNYLNVLNREIVKLSSERKPRSLEDLAKCVGRKVRIIEEGAIGDMLEQTVVYAGISERRHVFVRQNSDCRGYVEQWETSKGGILFPRDYEGIILDKDLTRHNILIREGNTTERFLLSRALLENLEMWQQDVEE